MVADYVEEFSAADELDVLAGEFGNVWGMDRGRPD